MLEQFGGDNCIDLIVFVRRKTCSGCKCPREEHEVYHLEWVNVKERLGFKAPTEPDKRNSRERSHGEGYAWVPPGLPSYKVSVSRVSRVDL